MLVEKYKPRKASELVQEKAARQLLKFILNFRKNKDKRAALVYGPVGSGKTAAVYALASELGIEIRELNADDFRNKKNIVNVLGTAALQQSLFSKGKILLVDELEAFSSRDRGGLTEIKNLIESSAWPVILITNKPFDERFKEIRHKTELIEFENVKAEAIEKILRKICAEEGINAEDSAIRQIALISKGDIRAAINDLQLATYKGKLDSSNLEVLGRREKETSIFEALRLIFKGNSASTALNAFDNVDAELDECLLWLDENLPLEYNAQELEKAYDQLSKAYVFRGRIRKQQHWRLLSYVNSLATAGIAIAKKKPSSNFTKYRRSSRPLSIWIMKRKNAEKNEIARKFAKVTHCSFKQAFSEMPYIEIMWNDNKFQAQLKEELRLEQNEIEYFNLKNKSL